jgi:hypothetical protein
MSEAMINRKGNEMPGPGPEAATAHLAEMRDVAAKIAEWDNPYMRERVGGDMADHRIAELGVELAELSPTTSHSPLTSP